MDNKFSWFGIDFGTTNSAAFSYTGTSIDDAHPISYGDDEGRPFPTIVAINKENGNVITGREAKERRNSLIETHEYFDSIKTIIDSEQVWHIANKKWTPVDIAAEIFSALKKRIEKEGVNIISEAVVAVPIGFTSKKKRCLREAASKAGINIKMFISEPTAAYCSNYANLQSSKNIAVFDWGGGTLDVVILKVDNGEIKELSSQGMSFAGNDIDLKLAEKMHSIFLREKKPGISFEKLDPLTKDQLLMKCEKLKCDFEDEEVVTISINRYGNYGSVRSNLDYNFFSHLIEKDIDNALKCLASAIDNAGLNKSSLDCILCVGGSSKLGPLRERLYENYGEELVYYPDKVMWDIAKGASIISTLPGGYTLNKSIGMLLSDGNFFPLMEKGQKIPCEEFKLILGTTDSQKSIMDNGEIIGNDRARFIFTDSDDPQFREFIEYLEVPLREFDDEYIKLNCYIDQDNNFLLKVGSNRAHENIYKVWSYDKLKVSFNLGKV